jgi:hypothetical protein
MDNETQPVYIPHAGYAPCVQQDAENINGIWEKIRR